MQFSRRAFLKGATLTGAAALAGSLVACAPASSQEKPEEGEAQVTHNPVETVECDVLVLGSGTAGTCAALSAAENGAKVILLEKLSVLGGTSVAGEGVGAVGSHLQKELGIELTAKELTAMSESYHHYACNHGVLKRFMEESGETISWLESFGVKFYEVQQLGASPATWHFPNEGGRKTGSVGEFMLPFLFTALEEKGIDVRLSTPATDLLIEEGAVKGAYANAEQGEILVKAAKGVVIATGGYANNAEMFEKYASIDRSRVRYWGFDGHDGDGINMGLAAGAALHKPGAVMWCFAVPPTGGSYEDPLAAAFSMWCNVWVNEDGKRFIKEGSTSDFTYIGNNVMAQNKVVSILTEAEIYMVQNGEAVMPVFGPQSHIPAVPGFVERAQNDADVSIFDTMDELAAFYGIDAEGLKATMEEYEGYCATGVDEEFGKDPAFLRSYAEGPYYAAELVPSLFCTVGGLKVNSDMQVMSEEGEPIPGLFAVGCDAGGLYGFDYDVGTMSGSQQGWCATGGRLAGISATK